MRYREHVSHPGYGWIEPFMDEDDPLIFGDLAEHIVALFEIMRDGYREVDWCHLCEDHPELRNLFNDDETRLAWSYTGESND